MKECAYCGHENEDDAVYCGDCGTKEFKIQKPPLPTPVEGASNLALSIRCRTLSEADLMVGRLKTAGIDAFIPDEFLMQAVSFNLNTYGFVRVQVPEKDLERAQAILAGELGENIAVEAELQGQDENDEEDPYCSIGQFDPLEARSLLDKFKENQLDFLIDQVERVISTGRGLRKSFFIEIYIHEKDWNKAQAILGEDWKA